MQTVQVALIFLSLILVALAFYRMQTVVGPCMLDGPLPGVSLLNGAAIISVGFQPIVLTKTIALLLYFHALHAGVRARQMARTGKVKAFEGPPSPHPTSTPRATTTQANFIQSIPGLLLVAEPPRGHRFPERALLSIRPEGASRH